MTATTATEPAALSEVPLFRGLSESQFIRLGGLLQGRAVPPGTAIVREGESGESAYIIRDGFVRIEVERADGTLTILAILGPGAVVGEMSLVDRLGRSATVVAHEPATVYAISRGAFWTCLQQMPTMTYNLVGIISRRLRLANEQIGAFGTMGVEGRLARQLLVFAEEYGEALDRGRRLPFRLSQSDLAGLVGASRVRVNQIMVEYRRRKYLSVDDHRRITILDPMALGEQAR